MSRCYVGLVVLASTVIISAAPACAADYAVHPRKARSAVSVLQIDRGPSPYCGPRCGCPAPVYVRHRSLEQAYPYTFDPRTKSDEPHYYYGRNRTYVRYVNPRNPDLVFQY
ncbi:hypothetical protein MTX26_22970 [Bradyrhizobium sp. ISRA443]|uniref:hypothetical protein n=1 Tax=unclassified Bradyrhizobium TaxID=2631580 RepID=UPI002478953B|nr:MULTISPECIES: hypothetical protein [unclassified Bradyrhizobium]WGR92819.1 hypothetical protein MTX20_33810 [Bradyrhizobium sp. ISRA435]WGR97287.1 hypothetical protein MTX23_22970 [Bradyrhizobium sp. ISRA436]WGS04176.1 hypothetical protein MTX18_22970 [Bradyrhizobium sp. ISRA437]WGS11059.1 hypothetical protein MTX26_22970 [Bradyrhizobium sp. ISRA443]